MFHKDWQERESLKWQLIKNLLNQQSIGAGEIVRKTGRKAFSQKLSKRIIDTKTSQQTYDLTSQLVGLD